MKQTYLLTSIASATGIRKAIIEQKQSLEYYCSLCSHLNIAILEQYIFHYQSFHHWEMYWPFLKYRILTSSATELAEICEVEEGIENRLIENAKHSSSFNNS